MMTCRPVRPVRAHGARRAALALASLAFLATADHAAAQSFGAAVLVDGDVVGFAEPASRLRPGVIRWFAPDGDDGTWEEVGALRASDGSAGDGFGTSVARSGDRLLVGAPDAADGRGVAYLFERQVDGAWAEAARLSAPAREAAGDGFGSAVALEGDLALVALDDGELLSMAGMIEAMIGPSAREREPGAVHAFRRTADATWRHAGRLALDGDAAGLAFGRAMAIRDGVAYVGAASADGRTGAIYVFRQAADGWERTGEIAGPETGSGFGAALALDESGRLVVGMPILNQHRGAVLVLSRDAESGEWTEDARLEGTGNPGSHVGASVAVHGDEIWAGGLPSAFSFTYDPDAGAWSDATARRVERAPGTEILGTEVALGAELAAIGFPEDDFGAGTGAVFVRNGEAGDGDWSLAATVAGEVDVLAAVTGGEITCEEGSAAEFECGDVDLLAFLPTSMVGAGRGVQVNDLWGWTDPDFGREIVIVGRGDGTAFVDATDPANPVYLGEVPRTPGSPESLWRDVKVYENHALIVSDNAGSHGMQVFDLTRLRNVSDPPRTFEPDAVYDGIHSAHNLVVNEETGMAYATGASGGGEACGGGLHAIDVRNPLEPTFAGCVTHQEANNPMAGVTHDSQCVVYRGPDTEHRGKQICMNSGLGGVMIVDVTDPSAPATLAVGKYPGSALPHQGWLTEDHRYFLHGDEGDEMQGLTDRTRTLVWDVTDLDDPVIGAEYLHPTREIDHNMYVRGDLVYQANYGAGLRILDVSNPERPVEVGYFDTVPYGEEEPSFALGAWSVFPYFDSGLIAVTSGAEGLFLLRHSPNEPPTS